MSDDAAVSWPACAEAMHKRARRMINFGASDEEVMRVLQQEFAGLMLATGPVWRRDAVYQNVLAAERMRAIKLEQQGVSRSRLTRDFNQGGGRDFSDTI